MTQSFLRRIPGVGSQTLRSWGLILMVIVSLIYGAADLVQGLEVGSLWLVGILALTLGWLLARSRILGRWAAVFSALGGVGYVFLQGGRLSVPVIKLLQSLRDYLLLSVESREFGDPLKLQLAIKETLVGIEVLFSRLYFWLLSLFSSTDYRDPIILSIVWGIAIWGMAVWLSWAIRRREQPISGAIPPILVLSYSLAYEDGNPLFLLPMLAAVLLLIIFVGHDSRERVWIQRMGTFPQIMRENVAWSAITVTAILVTLAAFSPSISIEDINEFYRKLTQDIDASLEKSLGLDPKPGSSSLAARQSLRLTGARQGGLPRQHLIGSGPELSQQVFMVISATELQPQLGGGILELPRPEDRNYYWRSLTFDSYNGLGWSTSDIEIETYRSGDLIVGSSRPGQHLLRQQVDLQENEESLMYVAGNLVSADTTFSAAWRPLTDSFAARDLFGATTESNTYLAASLLPLFSEDELRTANPIIPENISKHYLLLPSIISDRVISLATDLTATQPTLYDRAVAIESYLRGFEYDLDIPAPPSGENVEIADYFLFTLKRGYCDYYATAMVVLARAAGLPARFVQGYIGGEYDQVNGVYIVTEDLAHSWVEIYFPDFGWVEFEPTAGRPSIDRPTEDELASPQEVEGPQELEQIIDIEIPPFIPGDSGNRRLLLGIASIILFLPWAAILISTHLDYWRLGRMRSSPLIIEIYGRLFGYASRLNLAFPRGSTPHEIAPILSGRLTRLIDGKRAFSGYSTLHEEISWLTDQFTQTRYSPHEPEAPARKKAIQIWKRLRGALWAARWEAWRARYARQEEEQVD